MTTSSRRTVRLGKDSLDGDLRVIDQRLKGWDRKIWSSKKNCSNHHSPARISFRIFRFKRSLFSGDTRSR